MPRTAKRTQPAEAPQEQGYGVRGQQIAAQNAMPLPDNRSGGAPMPAQAAPPGAPTTPGEPMTGPGDILQMLQDQAPPPAGGLARPSDRPAEPMTAGLGTTNAAPTPSVNRAADVLDQIAAVTGDQRFVAMAQRARAI